MKARKINRQEPSDVLKPNFNGPVQAAKQVIDELITNKMRVLETNKPNQ